ncbi:uncharacterized protein LOC116349530 isoform X2 [Contarinia nasturtii]|uniref:uncharacterized protein LOC116349530 isoform X2 n=1 Tax=Contarinia nasturtii TaxID=265458 RepID=UPI0012D39A77|nr:uncharacterized protein LOC116349530 isoform X2 [Contarinia nasturtii]
MSNESWKRELDVLMKKIEQYSSDSLLRIKRECDHTGLPKGEKFRKMFLGITNTRIAKAFDKLERGTSEWGSRKRKTDESHSRDEGRCRSKSETYSLDRPSTSRTSKSTKSAASDMRISKERRDQSSNRKRKSGESVSREMDKSGSHQIEAENRSGKSGDSGSRKIDKGVSREMDKSSFREMDGKSSLKKTEVKSPTDLPAVDDGVTVKLHPCTLKFACVHCEKSKSLSPDTCSDNIETIYGHWLSAHTDLPNVRPFQFYVTQLVACHFCDQLGPFHEVIQHQITSHPNNSRIIVNESIRHQCALCDHSEDLADHFEQTHKVVIPNPFQVTDDVLDMLLKIDIHKKVECGHCNVVFETHHEFDHHHLMEHSVRCSAKRITSIIWKSIRSILNALTVISEQILRPSS